MNRRMRAAFDAIRRADRPVTDDALASWLGVGTRRARSVLGALRAEKLIRPGPFTCTWSLAAHGERMHTVLEVMES